MTPKKTCRSISKARIGTMRTSYVRSKTDKAKLIARAKKQGYTLSKKQGSVPNFAQKCGMRHKLSFIKKK